jgi:hypothetical protein
MKVDEWLYQNRDDYGGHPINGWTFIITYLPELPFFSFADEKDWGRNQRDPPKGTPHYYSISVTDFDGGYRYRDTDFMKGWGGKYRQIFLDLNAGPIPWTQARGVGWGDSPLQWALEDFDIKLGSTFGRTWLTNYLASYISEAVMNFAIPNFCYDPPLTDEYELSVQFLDHRSADEKSKVRLESRVNSDIIKAAFDDLCPYIKNTVTLKFNSTSDFPGLTQVIEDSRLTADSIFYSPSWIKGVKQDYVNMEPVYKYLQANIGRFVKDVRRDRTKVTFPVFVFVFSSSIRFYTQWKWFISDWDKLSFTFSGIALGDFVIIGYNHNYLIAGDKDTPKQPGKGLGFTHAVIHEVGHMVGLMHPHSYGWWGDFSLGAMSYFTSDVVFGQHDKDALRRNHVDKLMIEAGEQVKGLKGLLGTRVKSTETEVLVTNVEQLLKQAESDYEKMQYAEALGKAKDAIAQTKTALEKAKALTTLEQRVNELTSRIQDLSGELERTRALLPVVLIVGIVVGAAACLVVMKAVKKKETVYKPVA